MTRYNELQDFHTKEIFLKIQSDHGVGLISQQLAVCVLRQHCFLLVPGKGSGVYYDVFDQLTLVALCREVNDFYRL